MRTIWPILLLFLVAASLVSLAQEKQPPSIRELMSKKEFQAAGLNKLGQEELAFLDTWLQKYAAMVLQRASQREREIEAAGQQSYLIEVSHHDELFMINGERFRAKTHCFNMLEGDRVIFLEGNPYGSCTTAVLVNLRTGETCEVWCE